MPDEQNCAVVEIDHETLFDMQYEAEENDTIIPKEELQKNMIFVAENFFEYLNDIYENFCAEDDEDDEFED